MRQNHGDVKMVQKTTRQPNKMAQSMPFVEGTYGKPNRPQTPVNGIITNYYGDEEEAHLQQKYAYWKQSVSINDWCMTV